MFGEYEVVNDLDKRWHTARCVGDVEVYAVTLELFYYKFYNSSIKKYYTIQNNNLNNKKDVITSCLVNHKNKTIENKTEYGQFKN